MQQLVYNDSVVGGNTGEWKTYSKDEMAVGTWIDGRTVYRRVFETTSPNAYQVDTVIEEWTEDVDLLLIEGSIVASSGFIFPINKAASFGGTGIIATWLEVGDGITMYVGNDGFTNRPVIIIVEYVRR